MSTAVGFYFGVHGAWSFAVLFHALLGTALIASGTFTLNQWYEREADAKMRRTCERPLPTGRVTPRQAFWFGVALSAAGFLDLWLGANLLTAGLGLFTLLAYLLAYTPLKQRSKHSTTVGAIPGAMPPLIGFAASAGSLTVEAWVLFGILFFWQFPHFYSIAWMYREDYQRAGIRMLPVVEPDGESTARQILIYSMILIPVSLAPTFLAMSGLLYLWGALILGICFVYAGIRVARERTILRARGVLLASVVYLPLLYGLMLLDGPRL
jgi:heme o synthase